MVSSSDKKDQSVVPLDRPADWLLKQLNEVPEVIRDKEIDLDDDEPEEPIYSFLHIRSFFVRIAMAGKPVDKEKVFDELQQFLAILWNPIRTMPDKNFNIVPAQKGTIRYASKEEKSKPSRKRKIIFGPQKSKQLEEHLLVAALSLAYHAKRYPDRLKACRFCNFLYWDGNTRSANKSTCGETPCIQAYAAERSKESWWKVRREKVNRKRRKLHK